MGTVLAYCKSSNERLFQIKEKMGGLFEVGHLIDGSSYLIFTKSWRDIINHLFGTSSVRKQQHKLLIDIKS